MRRSSRRTRPISYLSQRKRRRTEVRGGYVVNAAKRRPGSHEPSSDVNLCRDCTWQFTVGGMTVRRRMSVLLQGEGPGLESEAFMNMLLGHRERAKPYDLGPAPYTAREVTV
jgi:hypothetical protein